MNIDIDLVAIIVTVLGGVFAFGYLRADHNNLKARFDDHQKQSATLTQMVQTIATSVAELKGWLYAEKNKSKGD